MIKTVIITIICAIIIIYLKNINSEFTILCSILAGIIVLYSAFNYVAELANFITYIAEFTGISMEMYNIIFKITAIGFLVEFGAGVIEDFGLISLANKLVFVGKITILVISLPVFYSLFNLVLGLIK
ncbi:MAG: hypothetical protein IKW33_05240 [Clostridia bacterium]|nr:hypothetical protein [Clostridia bacterium]